MGGAELVISEVTRQDTQQLGELLELLGRDPETSTYFHPHPLTMAAAAEICRGRERSRDVYFVGRIAGRLRGYGMLRGWDAGFQIPSFGIAVHPEARNSGIGRKMLEFAIDAARDRGALKLRLTVNRSNARAIHLYRSRGFVFEEQGADRVVGLLDLTARMHEAMSDAA